MKLQFSWIILAISITCFTAATSADTFFIQPTSYDMQNGGGIDHGGGWNYWDELYDGNGDTTTDGAWLSDGLGQLTDGIVGNDDWRDDLGNGPAFEWVGWWGSVDPTITFDFGRDVTFESTEIHINNSGIGSTTMFASADFSFSNDGVNFSDDLLYTTPPDEFADPSARFITIDTPRTARYLRVTLDHSSYWLFVSEFRFTGVPTPASWLLLPFGALLCTSRRRR